MVHDGKDGWHWVFKWVTGEHSEIKGYSMGYMDWEAGTGCISRRKQG